MRTRVDQVTDERIMRMQSNVDTMNQYVIGVLHDKLDIERNNKKDKSSASPTGSNSKKTRRR